MILGLVRDPRQFGTWLLVAAIVLYLVHAASFGSCLQDDAYISLRYARNLADGQGLVFNPGERVEGYTNFLWTVLCAIPFALGIDPARFLVGMGVVSGAGALLAAAFLARQGDPDSPLAPGTAAAISAGLPFFVAESIMGLETAAFAAFVVLACGLFCREKRSSTFPWSGAVLALAALSRPEGVMVAGILCVSDLFDAVRERRVGRSRLVRWLLFVAPVAAHVLFRLAYYGELVPNTFHAKVGGGLALAARGLSYAGSFAFHAWPLLIAAGLGVAVLLRDRAGRNPALPMLLAVPVVYVLYVIVIGGDYKETSRFFAPPALFFAALGGVGIARSVASLRFPALWRLGATAAVVVAMIALGGPTREFGRARSLDLRIDREIGRWLKAHLPPTTLLATCNAGVIPFEASLPTIDMLGLCDRRIARAEVSGMGRGDAGHEKADPEYVLGQKPDVVLFRRARASRRPVSAERIAGVLMWKAEEGLWADPRFAREYVLRTTPLGDFYFNYFEKKGLGN